MKQITLFTFTLILGVCIGSALSTPREIILPSTLDEKNTANLDEWHLLQMALVKTESDFDTLATGKAKDRGIFQITPVYVKEVNRISGKRYSELDAYSLEKSLEMFNILQNHYNPERDIIKAIKLHNPRAGKWYQKKVLSNMNKIMVQEKIRTYLF